MATPSPSYLGLRLSGPFQYQTYENGATGWDFVLNFQVIDQKFQQTDIRIATLEAQTGATPGFIDGGTF